MCFWDVWTLLRPQAVGRGWFPKKSGPNTHASSPQGVFNRVRP